MKDDWSALRCIGCRMTAEAVIGSRQERRVKDVTKRFSMLNSQ